MNKGPTRDTRRALFVVPRSEAELVDGFPLPFLRRSPSQREGSQAARHKHELSRGVVGNILGAHGHGRLPDPFFMRLRGTWGQCREEAQSILLSADHVLLPRMCIPRHYHLDRRSHVSCSVAKVSTSVWAPLLPYSSLLVLSKSLAWTCFGLYVKVLKDSFLTVISLNGGCGNEERHPNSRDNFPPLT